MSSDFVNHPSSELGSFLGGRPVISRARMDANRQAGSSATAGQQPVALPELEAAQADVRAVPLASGAVCDGPPPRVEVISEKGRITRLKITCSCGKITELDCLYGQRE